MPYSNPVDAGADDDNRARQFLQVHYVVAGANFLTVELDMRVLCRFRADGDDHLVCGGIPMPVTVQPRQAYRMVIDERPFRLQKFDTVALELLPIHAQLVGDHIGGAH